MRWIWNSDRSRRRSVTKHEELPCEKETNEIGRNRKQGVGGEKRRKWKGKKKGKKQKWKLTPFPLSSPPPSAKEESLFPRVSSSVEEKERKKKKKEECFYETKWQLFLLSKMDYLVRKT